MRSLSFIFGDIGPTTCSSSSAANTVGAASTSQLKSENSIPQMQAACPSTVLGRNASALSTSYSSINDASDDESDVEITQVTKGVLDKRASLGSLNDSHFDIINSPTGWLDCTIIQQAQVYLQKVNPLIESFQKTTLAPLGTLILSLQNLFKYYILDICTGSA